MIRLAEQITELEALCADSPFGCQILSAANAYGLGRSFAQFWKDVRMTDSECARAPRAEETTAQGGTMEALAGAAYSKLDGVMRICGEITDAEEAQAFLRAVGAESVVCSAENAEKLALQVTDCGVILYKDLRSAAKPEEYTGRELSLKAVYDVLKSCDMVGDFEPFYLDLSHRVRHGTALCTAMYADAEMAAAAVGVYGVDCALITAVGVKPMYRRNGFGTQVVRQMEKKLSGRVYLLRTGNENERFYASLGYTPCGAWCAGELG